MFLFLLIIAVVFSRPISLDEFVAPFSLKISHDVGGNMTASLFLGKGRKFKASPLQSRYISRVYGKFNSRISLILKSHLQTFLVI